MSFEITAIRFRNRVAQLIHPGRKIFIIGPHRSATTTLHQFFSSQGLKSIHWQQGNVFLAKEIESRLGNEISLRRFLSRWTVFSDFVYLTESELIENHTRFALFEKLFPESYFILNDRNVDRWINSRLLHRDGDWLRRYLCVKGGTREDAISTWRHQFLSHRENVLRHFAGNSRFLHFRIDGNDSSSYLGPGDVEALTTFLSQDYVLSPSQWRKFNTDRRADRLKMESGEANID